MADKQTQALGRLAKKLSALRATLRRDERDLLDELIVGRTAEVAAHSMNAAAAKAARMPKAAEVAAHSMNAAAAKAATTSKVTEVAAHSMNAAASKSAKTARVARVSARTANEMIEFDEAAKAYRVKAA